MSEKADIKELAVAAWRLEKWLENQNIDRKMAAKSALRSIKKYIAASGIEVKDPLGAKFDPGLAVEVVNNETEEAPEEMLIITETISPYIYQDGVLVQHAKVIIGSVIPTLKEKSDISKVSTSTISPNGIDKDMGKTQEESKSEIVSVTDSQKGSCGAGEDEEILISTDEIERMMAYAKIL